VPTARAADVFPAERWRAIALGVLFLITGLVGLLLEQALEKLITSVVASSTPAAAWCSPSISSARRGGGGLYARLGATAHRCTAL
jgi:hypothetical protein